MAAHPEYADGGFAKNKNPIFRRIVLGMFVMGLLVKIVSKAYILLRQNNWMHRNLRQGI
jgi:hypothetical protein